MQKVELSYSELGFLVYACRSLKDYYKFLNANFPDKVPDQMLTELLESVDMVATKFQKGFEDETLKLKLEATKKDKKKTTFFGIS